MQQVKVFLFTILIGREKHYLKQINTLPLTNQSTFNYSNSLKHHYYEKTSIPSE